MEHVALDPLPAVQEVAQCPDAGVDLVGDAHGMLERVRAAHLVGHGADAADARRNVRHLAEVAPAEKRLVEARGLVDPQAGVGHLALLKGEVKGAFAFDPRQSIDSDRSGFRVCGRVVHICRSLA